MCHSCPHTHSASSLGWLRPCRASQQQGLPKKETWFADGEEHFRRVSFESSGRGQPGAPDLVSRFHGFLCSFAPLCLCAQPARGSNKDIRNFK